MHSLAEKRCNQKLTVNCYRAPGSDSVDTKQSMAVNRDNITGNHGAVDCSTSKMHRAVKIRYSDILPDEYRVALSTLECYTQPQ